MSGGKAAGLLALSEVTAVPRFVVIGPECPLDPPTLFTMCDRAGVQEPLAVRSSADVEDGNGAAFAGMFDTRLGVARAELASAIAAVRGSVNSARVRSYASARRLPVQTNMNVIVQNMVDSRVAGVCATRLPEMEQDAITIESVWGLGESLVSGAATPDVSYVDRATRRIERGAVGNQLVELRLGQGKTLVSPHLRSVAKLTDDELTAITDVALAVERKLGWPAVDLEWAFDDDQLWALQARPVTSVSA